MESKKKQEERIERKRRILQEAKLSSMFFVRKELEKALRDLAGMKLSDADEAFVVNLACANLRKGGENVLSFQVPNSRLRIIAERILANTEANEEKSQG